MPKNLLSVALKNHLSLAVTSLTMCWRIVRLDGATFGFTTLDQDLIVLGVRYQSVSGFSQTAVQSGTSGQVDNLQVLGFFSDTGITENDVKNRLFDYASIYLFMVNWRDLTMGQLNLRRGWLGETVIATNGAFAAELRGLNQALVQEFGNFFSPLCRNDLGDFHCQIPILPPLWQPNWSVGKGQYVRQFTAPTDDQKVAIYQAQNAGTTWVTEPPWSPAQGSTTNDNDIVWLSHMPLRLIGYAVAPGDQHNFTSTPLTFRSGFGTTAQIAVINDISRNTAIEISDGVKSWGYTFPFDVKAKDALFYVWVSLPGSGLNMTYTPMVSNGSYHGIQFENHTGQQGDITKTGDILGGLIIDNFGDTFLDAGTVTWATGFNAGVSMELKTYNSTSNVVTSYLGLAMPVTPGDQFYYYPGCDKRRDTCVKKFNNIGNFRAEPDIPGIDKMLSYPDS
jgi:hypothetical protein